MDKTFTIDETSINELVNLMKDYVKSGNQLDYAALERLNFQDSQDFVAVFNMANIAADRNTLLVGYVYLGE